MIVKMDPELSPQSNLIEFKRGPRVGTIEPVRKKYSDCKHERVTVCEGSREVRCSACDALMDPFQVLYELAWKQRHWLEELDHWDAYRESKLAERYDREWEKRSGDITEPPVDSEKRKVWDVLRACLGEKFSGMYRRKARKLKGPEWYGVTTDGGCISYEYARQKLTPKAVTSK